MAAEPSTRYGNEEGASQSSTSEKAHDTPQAPRVTLQLTPSTPNDNLHYGRQQ